MFQEAYLSVCSGAKAKAGLLKNNPLGFFVSSMMAGLFIAFGGFISIGISAPFFEAGDPMQKVMNSASFAVALSFVLMCGAELLQEAISYWEQQDSAGSLDGERSQKSGL